MAQKKKKTASVNTGGLREFSAPPGSKEVTGMFGSFWNPEEEGDSLEGVLVGTTPIENARHEKIDRFILLDGDGKVWTLPDHVDLTGKLRRVKELSRVYIEYLGREPVQTRGRGAVSMLRYGVADYGPVEGGDKLADAALHR